MTNREASRLYFRWAKGYIVRHGRSRFAALICLQTALIYRALPPSGIVGPEG